MLVLTIHFSSFGLLVQFSTGHLKSANNFCSLVEKYFRGPFSIKVVDIIFILDVQAENHSYTYFRNN